jgi:hypothetical protein
LGWRFGHWRTLDQSRGFAERVCQSEIHSSRQSSSVYRDEPSNPQVNRLKPVIDRVFTFEEAADAFRYYQAGKFFGKIVITHE